MSRTRKRPDIDLGFLRLHPDGAVTVNFRINHVEIHAYNDKVAFDFKRDLAYTSLFADRDRDFHSPLWEDMLLQSRQFRGNRRSFVLTKEYGTACGHNTNTRFTLDRSWQVSWLYARRSRSASHFIHYQDEWSEVADEATARSVWVFLATRQRFRRESRSWLHRVRAYLPIARWLAKTDGRTS